MKLYHPKQAIVQAVRWHKNGDHPKDDVWRPFEDTGLIPKEPREGKVVRYYRHPGVDGYSRCKICGRLHNEHGWIDRQWHGLTVCPGYWIVDFPDGRIQVMSDVAFRGGWMETGAMSDGYHTFDELYEHRHALFLALLSCHAGVLPTWMSTKHDDGTAMEGWFVAGIRLLNGMISYHMPDRLWEACKVTKAEVLERAPKWDGHTSDDVVKRLMEFAKA